ncbi:MAG: glycosyl transferase family 2 [Erythrobacter sp.]|nr:glycosyl transferase family 2 [Erythrobacter sp.]
MFEAQPFTVIIPAHNEETVIARCLLTILECASQPQQIQIIVAANGCNDRTVEIARMIAPHATVLDLPVGSKTAAINAANHMAKHVPRIYIDADVECSFRSLAALAKVLGETGVMTAAPAIRLDVSRCNWLMRAYYRAWSHQPYATAGQGGAGCYGLSAEALAILGEFPPIIADDLWVHTRFSDAQRRHLTEDSSGQAVYSIVRPPQTAIEQIRVEARRAIGTAEVTKCYPGPHAISGDGGGLATNLPDALKNGLNLADAMIYFAIKICARLLARWRLIRGRGAVWSRDLGSRAESQPNG